MLALQDGMIGHLRLPLSEPPFRVRATVRGPRQRLYRNCLWNGAYSRRAAYEIVSGRISGPSASTERQGTTEERFPSLKGNNALRDQPERRNRDDDPEEHALHHWTYPDLLQRGSRESRTDQKQRGGEP